MDYINDLDNYAIVLIYPDGKMEQILKDTRVFHMEYMTTLIKKSERLQEIIKRNEFYIPTDELEIKLTLTYPLDKLLSQEGIITIHNLDFNESDELEDWERVFHITLPSEFTDYQKEIFGNIINSYDLSTSWYGKIMDDELIDIEYDEVKELVKRIIK